MVGDNADFVARLKMVLPRRWFGDATPVLDALLSGFATAWSGLYALLAFVKVQTRIATATGLFLDMIAQDFFGGLLPRRDGEADTAYSLRIRKNLILPRATRPGLVSMLTDVTGRAPVIFEPRNIGDTGAYNVNLGFNTAGGYGSFNMPYQFFLTVYRPDSLPTSNVGGYGFGPGGYNQAPLLYTDARSLAGTLGDAEIYQAVTQALPANAVAWTNISN